MNFHRIKKVLKTENTLPPHEWKGAVLFLCNKDYVFFIKRSETMPTHSGQVAFFGGHKKPHESDPWIVAQREFEEETHLDPSSIDFLGVLPSVMTARMQTIIPVVAHLNLPMQQFLQDVKSNGEWDQIMVYPWSELMMVDRWEFAWRHGYGKSPVFFHTMRAGTYLPSSHNTESHLLWGATASMVWSLLKLMHES